MGSKASPTKSVWSPASNSATSLHSMFTGHSFIMGGLTIALEGCQSGCHKLINIFAGLAPNIVSTLSIMLSVGMEMTNSLPLDMREWEKRVLPIDMPIKGGLKERGQCHAKVIMFLFFFPPPRSGSLQELPVSGRAACSHIPYQHTGIFPSINRLQKDSMSSSSFSTTSSIPMETDFTSLFFSFMSCTAMTFGWSIGCPIWLRSQT